MPGLMKEVLLAGCLLHAEYGWNGYQICRIFLGGLSAMHY